MAAAAELWEKKDAFLQLLMEKTTEAEEHRVSETNAAVLIQKSFRGYLVRKSLGTLRDAAIVIQSCYRMYRGQLRAEEKKRESDRLQRRRYFHLAAVEIQRHWRGYSSRKNVHDFYARAGYIAKVMQRTEELRAASERLAKDIMRQQEEAEREQQQRIYDARLRSLHHLLSTKSMPGVMNESIALSASSSYDHDGMTGNSIEEKIKTLNMRSRHRQMIKS